MIVPAFGGALRFARTRFQLYAEAFGNELDRAAKPTREHVARPPAAASLVLEHEGRVLDSYHRAAALGIDPVHVKLPPPALGEPLHVVVKDFDAHNPVPLRFLIAPYVGGLVARREQLAGILPLAERRLDGEVIVDEEMPRHEDHRH